jgi:hypothetical protein
VLLDHPQDLLSHVPTDRTEAHRLAAQIQMEEVKIHAGGIPPDKVARDLVLALWRKALRHERSLLAPGEARRVEITLQLKQLDRGWTHSVDFLVI